MAVRSGKKVRALLNKNQDFKTIALVGASSEIGNAVVRSLGVETLKSLFIFGRDSTLVDSYQSQGIDTQFFQLDVEKKDFHKNLQENLNSLGPIDLAILALGYLPQENKDSEPNFVLQSMLINATGSSVVLSCFVNKMLNQHSGKILYISSVASMRPRIKNFTYGASKKAVDFFVQGLQSKYRKSNLKISLVRPGYVYTKMSKNFKPAPFAIKSDKVAQLAIKGLQKQKEVIYAPSVLFFLMNLVIRFPRFIFNRLS